MCNSWNELSLTMPGLAAGHPDPSTFAFGFARPPLKAEHIEQMLVSHGGGAGQRWSSLFTIKGYGKVYPYLSPVIWLPTEKVYRTCEENLMTGHPPCQSNRSWAS